MSILRYSFIVDDFYGIKLPREHLALVDAHFFAASHHFYYSTSDDLTTSRFHQERFWKHVSALMQIVMHGDFSRAFDNTNRGLDRPEGWNPNSRFASGLGHPHQRKGIFVDPEMFIDMQPDPTYQPGEEIPYDLLLTQPRLRLSQIRHREAFA